jgi:hypothetical protein
MQTLPFGTKVRPAPLHRHGPARVHLRRIESRERGGNAFVRRRAGRRRPHGIKRTSQNSPSQGEGVAIVTQQRVDFPGKLDLFSLGPRLRRRDGGEEFEQLRA